MPLERHDSFDKIRENARFDVLVIGGGINGLGVYRELALQGLRVLLVERNDFCSGCSAAPSRMIHGGLRYLENGEFGLVKESRAERGALPMKIGLTLYDPVTRGRGALPPAPGPQRQGNRPELVALLPRCVDFLSRTPRSRTRGRHRTDGTGVACPDLCRDRPRRGSFQVDRS